MILTDPKNADRARVMVIAGESSGDHHGAQLVRAALDIRPGMEFFGVGGPLMEAAGCRVTLPFSEINVSGFTEVIRHLPRLWRIFRQLKKLLYGPEKPDLLVLIDFPGFNIRFAEKAKAAGIPVLYYVSPQVWAWKGKRVVRIAKVVDRLAVIFPFEVELYEGLDLEVEYVGNPLMEEIDRPRDPDRFRQEHGVIKGQSLVGLFPGSRIHEIENNMPTLLEAATILNEELDGVSFLVPVANYIDPGLIEKTVGNRQLSLKLIRADIYSVADACDVVITAAGTVTLQTALTLTPMVIFYKMTHLSYLIARAMVRIQHIGLPNIVAGRQIVREYVQDQATGPNLAGEARRLLVDEEYRGSVVRSLAELRDRLTGPECSSRVAEIIVEMIEE